MPRPYPNPAGSRPIPHRRAEEGIRRRGWDEWPVTRRTANEGPTRRSPRRGALAWARRERPRGLAEVAAARGSGGERLEWLLGQVAGGSEEAFAELYRDVAAAVFGLVGRVVRNPAQAQEVTQEVFVELWRRGWRRWGEGRG